MEYQLKELMRRKFKDEISRADKNCTSNKDLHDLNQSDQYIMPQFSSSNLFVNECDSRPVSALLSQPQRQHLIQYALPENKNMLSKKLGMRTTQYAFGRYTGSSEQQLMVNPSDNYSGTDLHKTFTNKNSMNEVKKAKKTIESAVIEIQQDLDFKRQKDSILMKVMDECQYEILTKDDSQE